MTRPFMRFRNPNDPTSMVDPDDPNLSATAPPNPANMRLPEGESPNRTWYVLSGSPVIGMTSSWHITRSITSGISGAVFASYPSWDEALRAYTLGYNANAVQIITQRTNRALRRAALAQAQAQLTQSGNPAQPQSQAAQSGSSANPVVITSSAPTTPQRPSAPNTPSATPGASRNNPYFVSSSLFPSGHPQHPFYIGSSPVSSPARVPQRDTPSMATGPPIPSTPAHTSTNDVRSRLRIIEGALERYVHRQGISVSPQTPTPFNSTVEARLSAVEAAINRLLANEARQESQGARSLRPENMDGRDITPSPSIRDGRDVTPAHSPAIRERRDLTPTSSVDNNRRTTPARSYSVLDGYDPLHFTPSPTPVAGSSTGPGTIAGQENRLRAGPSNLRSPIALDPPLCPLEDTQYPFDDYSAEEEEELTELLFAIHENYNANNDSYHEED